MCKELYYENPLKFWEKDKSFATIELIDPKVVIRVKQMFTLIRINKNLKNKLMNS